MARGNQREISREKNLKKQAAAGGAAQSAANAGLTPEQRNNRDAVALAEKQKAKADKAAQDGGDAPKFDARNPGTKEKKPKEKEDLSALSAAIAPKKKK